MRISQVLRSKRPDVVTISPDASVRSAITVMNREHVGALVVIDSEQHLQGVISERDIIQCLDAQLVDLGLATVGGIMRTDGPTATLDDTLQSVMEVMTSARARHVPIIRYGRPVGIVSIGDIVKSRLDETMKENSVLQDIARNHWLTS